MTPETSWRIGGISGDVDGNGLVHSGDVLKWLFKALIFWLSLIAEHITCIYLHAYSLLEK